jgi:hypothetical protein
MGPVRESGEGDNDSEADEDETLGDTMETADGVFSGTVNVDDDQ